MVKLLCLAVRKSVLIWQICFIHLSCLSSQNQHFGIVYCSLFFFCDTFSNTDLKCKEGYYMCESYFLSIYFATCVIMF